MSATGTPKSGLFPPVGNHLRTLAASVSASFGSMALGSVIGYTSPAIPDLNSPTLSSPFRLDDAEVAWVASVISIGGLLGTPAGGILLDKYGRKTVLLLLALPFVVGWVLIACSTHFVTLCLARLLTGFCCGVVDVAVPVYLAELAPKEIRGFTGSCYELATNVGLMFVFVAGCFLRWNWLAVACSCLPAIMFILMLPMPESPRWLVAHGRIQEAKDVLRWLRGGGEGGGGKENGSTSRVGATKDDKLLEHEMIDNVRDVDIAAELEEIEMNVRTSSSNSLRLCDITTDSSIYRPFLIVGGLMFFQQFSGYGVIPEYMVHIFQSTNTTWDPYVQTAVVGLFGVIANLVSALVVDRMGRRPMLIISALMMVLSLSGLSVFFTLKNNHRNLDSVQWAPGACLVAYNFGVALGFGPVPFFLASELFPLRARGLASGLAISCVWCFMFVTNLSFPHALRLLDEYGVYWIMTGFAVVAIAFVLWAVPETKGKSLEAIERYFARGRRAFVGSTNHVNLPSNEKDDTRDRKEHNDPIELQKL